MMILRFLGIPQWSKFPLTCLRSSEVSQENVQGFLAHPVAVDSKTQFKLYMSFLQIKCVNPSVSASDG